MKTAWADLRETQQTLDENRSGQSADSSVYCCLCPWKHRGIKRFQGGPATVAENNSERCKTQHARQPSGMKRLKQGAPCHESMPSTDGGHSRIGKWCCEQCASLMMSAKTLLNSPAAHRRVGVSPL